MTLAEFHAFCAGFAESKGAKPDDTPTDDDYDRYFEAAQLFATRPKP